MKRTALLKELKKLARTHGGTLDLIRQGGNHEQWDCAGTRVTIGRHNEIPEGTARAILRNAKKELNK